MKFCAISEGNFSERKFFERKFVSIDTESHKTSVSFLLRNGYAEESAGVFQRQRGEGFKIHGKKLCLLFGGKMKVTGMVDPPPHGDGGKIGAVGFGEDTVEGQGTEDLPGFTAFLKVMTPEKEKYHPRFASSAAISRLPEKECSTPRTWGCRRRISRVSPWASLSWTTTGRSSLSARSSCASKIAL